MTANKEEATKLVRVGVIQMTSTSDVQANLAALGRTTARAAEEGAKLVVAPECFAYMGPEDGRLQVAESLPAAGEAAAKFGPVLSHCADLARRHGVELLLGGFWEKSRDARKVRNACVQLRADGSLGAVYRKIHLFDVDLPDGSRHRESDSVEPGTEVVVAETVAGKVGLSICYDLRFPELYRHLVVQGATLLTVPSAFTLVTGKEHWHVLLRARAIENQCYVLAAAQTGHHYGNRHSYGHALIVDPWGAVLAQCGEGEGVAVATVDPRTIARVRQSIPCLQHRRV